MLSKAHFIFKNHISGYIRILLFYDLFFIVCSIQYIIYLYKNKSNFFDKLWLLTLFSVCTIKLLYCIKISYKFSTSNFFSKKYNVILLFLLELLNFLLIIIGTIITANCISRDNNSICEIYTVIIAVFWFKCVMLLILFITYWFQYDEDRIMQLNSNL